MNGITHPWARTNVALLDEYNQIFEVSLTGRELWALKVLYEAGTKGCTARQFPGARIAAYVHGLRQKEIQIKTELEAHQGAFPSIHAIYSLQSRVIDCQTQGAK